MYAIQQPASFRSNPIQAPARPVSIRAAFGIWGVASIGGWLFVAALLRAFGII